MNLQTRRMLFETIRTMGAKSVLDIGTYVGVSAMNYAIAVGIGGSVVTVDIKDANAEDGFWKTTGRPMSPERMLKSVGVNHRVEFVTQDSVEFMRATDRTFDFISIDGWHEAHQVYKEIELAMQCLNPGGLIFMDDVQPFNDWERPQNLDYIDGPYKALRQHLDEGAEIEPVTFSETYGSWTATAFLLRRT
jgi:O-methyltransferase